METLKLIEVLESYRNYLLAIPADLWSRSAQRRLWRVEDLIQELRQE